jgi:hypothetical protein
MVALLHSDRSKATMLTRAGVFPGLGRLPGRRLLAEAGRARTINPPDRVAAKWAGTPPVLPARSTRLIV